MDRNQLCDQLETLFTKHVRKYIRRPGGPKLRFVVRDIISEWLYVLQDNFKDSILDPASLDDAMLPKNQLFFGLKGADADVMAILRKVKQSLPNGKFIPDEAIKLLKLNGVQIKE